MASVLQGSNSQYSKKQRLKGWLEGLVSLLKMGELKSQGTQNNISCNKFNFFHFSKQSNFLLVGTADGNLVIFEDNTIKVNGEYILHKSVFLKT